MRSPSSQAIRCTTPEDFETYDYCLEREDITYPLKITFLICFLVTLLLLIPAARNIYSTYSKKFTINPITRIINGLLALYLFLRLSYFADSLLQLAGIWTFPLYSVIIMDYASVLTLNTAMVVSAYSWCTTILAVAFNNSRRPINKAITLILSIGNLICLILATVEQLRLQKTDDTIIDYEILDIWIVSRIVVAASTAFSGIYFITVCMMLFGYIDSNSGQNRCSNSCSQQLSLAIAVVSFVRMGRSGIAGVLGPVRRNSIIEQDLVWPSIIFTYLLITEFLPTIVLLSKFSPTQKQKIRSSSSEVSGVKTIVFNEADIENEYERLTAETMYRSKCNSHTLSSKKTTVDWTADSGDDVVILKKPIITD